MLSELLKQACFPEFPVGETIDNDHLLLLLPYSQIRWAHFPEGPTSEGGLQVNSVTQAHRIFRIRST